MAPSRCVPRLKIGARKKEDVYIFDGRPGTAPPGQPAAEHEGTQSHLREHPPRPTPTRIDVLALFLFPLFFSHYGTTMNDTNECFILV